MERVMHGKTKVVGTVIATHENCNCFDDGTLVTLCDVVWDDHPALIPLRLRDLDSNRAGYLESDLHIHFD